MRDLRTEERERKLSPRSWRWGLKLHGWLARMPRLYQALTGVLIKLMHLLGRRRGSFRSLLVRNGWTAVRDFPAPENGTFMSQWKKRGKEDE